MRITSELLTTNHEPPISHDLKQVELQIIRFRDIPEDGMVRRLLAPFDLAEADAGVFGGGSSSGGGADLSKYMPKDGKRLPASKTSLEKQGVSDANGLSNFEKVTRQVYELRRRKETIEGR